MAEFICDFDCKNCNMDQCPFDTVEKHKARPATEKQLRVWQKRKNTRTKRQLEAIEIYRKYQISGDKSSKEYRSAYEVVRYLRTRDKRLQDKKEKYKKRYLLEES